MPDEPVITDTPPSLTCEGTRTYTYTYTDCGGATSEWTYTYTIEHVTPPSIVGDPIPVSATIECPSMAGGHELPTVIDVCENIVPAPEPVITNGTYDGCEGTIIYTYNYVDCGGLEIQWVFTYDVQHTIPPAPVGQPVENSSAVDCYLLAVEPAVVPEVHDVCGNVIPPPVPEMGGTNNGGCDGTVTYTYLFEDCAGLTYEWVYTYNIECSPIDVSVFLEGPYNTTTDQMNNTLNVHHLLPGQDKMLSSDFGVKLLAPYTPFGQPYNVAPWNYNGNTGMNYGDPSAPDAPMGVIAYPADVVDWVLVSIRENGITPAENIWKCAGWVHEDGRISFPENCTLPSVNTANTYYIMVEHRNHLAVMSPLPVDELCGGSILKYDFRIQNSYQPVFTFGQKEVEPGVWAMHAANGSQSAFPSSIGAINNEENTLWIIFQNALGYHNADFDMNFSVNNNDFTIWTNNQNKTSGIIFY